MSCLAGIRGSLQDIIVAGQDGMGFSTEGESIASNGEDITRIVSVKRQRVQRRLRLQACGQQASAYDASEYFAKSSWGTPGEVRVDLCGCVGPREIYRKLHRKKLKQRLQKACVTAKPKGGFLNLWMFDIGLSDRNCPGIVSILKEFKNQIAHINLGRNKFLVEGARKLAATFLDFPTLRSLYLAGNRSLGPVGCAAIADAVATGNVCKALSLEDCQLCQFHFDLGVKQIAKLCETSTSLQHLDLSRNGIRAPQLRIICEGIAKRDLRKSSLCSLDLSMNQIGDDGIICLANAIRLCSHGEDITAQPWEIMLRHCEIGFNGAQALACLIEDGFIRSLDVSFNPITEDGVACFARAIVPCCGGICKKMPMKRRALLPETVTQVCTCGNLKALRIMDESLDHALCTNLAFSALQPNCGWTNGVLQHLSILCQLHRGKIVRREAVAYCPLKSGALFTLIICIQKHNLPPEIAVTVASFLCNPVYRVVRYSDLDTQLEN